MERDGQLQVRVARGGERLGGRVDVREADRLVREGRLRVQLRELRLDRGAARPLSERLVEGRDRRPGRGRLRLLDEVGERPARRRRGEGPGPVLLPLTGPLEVPVLEARLPLEVGLPSLRGPADGGEGRPERGGEALDLLEEEAPVLPGAVGGEDLLELGGRGGPLGRQVLLRGEELRELGRLRLRAGGDAVAGEPLDLAAGVRLGVRVALDRPGDAQGGVGVPLPLRLEDRDQVRVGPRPERVEPPLQVLDRRGGQVALGPPGVAGDHHDVALGDPLRRDAEPPLRAVRDVLLRVRCRLAVGGDVDPEDREVARVARPAEVVVLAAELADPAGRGVDEPHVAELDLLHQAVGAPVLEGRDGAAPVGLLLALGDDLAPGPLDGRLPRGVGLRLREGALRAADAAGHVDEAGEDPHPPGAAPRLHLPGARPRDESVREVVPLGRRGELDRAEGAVVVRQEEPLLRDEGPGAASEAEDGRQEAAPLPVPEVLRAQLEPAGGELLPARLAERGEGLGGPLPLVGDGENGQGEEGEEGEECDSARSHGVSAGW